MVNLMEEMAEQCMCPIMRAPMKDPVLTDDGHTYEREAIRNWFKTSQKSPVTGLQHKTKNLIPNIALKNLNKRIVDLVPLQMQKMNALEVQNQFLKSKILTLQSQLTYHQQKFLETQEISKKHMKLTKIEEKRSIQKIEDLQKTQKQTLKLNNKIREMNKKIIEIKNEYESEIEKNEKKIKEMKKQIFTIQKDKQQEIKKRQKLCQQGLNQFQGQVNNITNILVSTMLTIIHEIKISTGSEKEKLLQLQRNITKVIKGRCDYRELKKTYQMYKILTENMTNEKFPMDTKLIEPSLYINFEENIFRTQYMFGTQTIWQIEKGFEENGRTDECAQFRSMPIQLMIEHSDEESLQKWKDIQNFCHKYTNLKSIVIYDQIESIKHLMLKKQDFEKFTNLGILKYSQKDLDPTTLRQIKEFLNNHPHIISDGNS